MIKVVPPDKKAYDKLFIEKEYCRRSIVLMFDFFEKQKNPNSVRAFLF